MYSSLPGGPADKAGNNYEALWGVKGFLRLLAAQVDEIRIETPGVDGAEFCLRYGDVIEQWQTKRQILQQKTWSLNALSREGILTFFAQQVRLNKRCVLASISDAPELRILADHARAAKDCDEFLQEFLSSDRRTDLEELCAYWEATAFEAYHLLAQIEIEGGQERTLTYDNLLAAKLLLTGNERTAVAVLSHIYRESAHKSFTRARLIEALAVHGINPTVLARALPGLTTEEVLARFKSFSQFLLGRVVPRESWISREEEEQLLLHGDGAARKTICLLGGPGSGKTALLAKVASDAARAGYVTIAIKADQIPFNEPFERWGERLVGMSLLYAVQFVARERKTVVIVDQLDALAGLVDLTSSRLNDVIAFITDCARIPQVSVVCSCREVEYWRDTRFAALDAHPINLALPSWEQIVVELEKAGIEGADSWSQEFREILRTPQHLHVYLERFRGTASAHTFQSYQGMLDDLWHRILVTEEQRSFVYRLTEYLTQKESLWAPLVIFESDTDAIEQLEAEQFLQRQDKQVGFRHQTLLEHARARLFTKSDQSLSAYVLARQDAILVRPTLWAVLSYLRDADRAKYHRELDQFFGSALRLHIRFLLIDFLGQVNDPDSMEIVHLAERLKHSEDRLRVLIAIRGRQKWFHALRTTHFPSLMRMRPNEQWPMIGVIQDAWGFAHEECQRLIKDHWFPYPEADELTQRALREIDHWGEETVNMARQLIRRAISDEEPLWWGEQFVYAISADEPTLAPKVFLEVVERSTRNSLGRIARRGKSPLDGSNTWYELPGVVEAAPKEFLREVWPWFVATCTEYHGGSASSVLYEYGGSLYAMSRTHGHRDYVIVASLLKAIATTASTSPSEFVDITRDAWTCEHEAVQIALARGFTVAASSVPDEAFKFLVSDPRRFMLGSYETDGQGDSMELVEAIAMAIDEEGRQRLESAIMSWSPYRPGNDLCDMGIEFHRKLRLRLLKAIPIELLSAGTAEHVRNEEADLPDWQPLMRTSGKSGFLKEVPPLSKAEMLTSSDDEILQSLAGPWQRDRAFNERREVEGGWEQPGGPPAAAKELAELATEHPSRVLPLIPRLIASGHEQAASQVIRSLPGTELPCTEAYEIARLVASVDLPTEELRSSTGYLLYKRCKASQGLPDDLCDVLKNWLSMPWREEPGLIQRIDEEETDRPIPEHDLASILWAYGTTTVTDTRAFWPLLALTEGYLTRVPSETRRWLDAINNLLDGSIDTDTWTHFCEQLRWIRLAECDVTQGVAVVRKLFETHAAIRRRGEGIRLVARVNDLLPEEFVLGFLKHLNSSARFQHRQGSGELLAYVALAGNGIGWARSLLEETLSGQSAEIHRDEATLAGIAFAAARLWDGSESREEANRVLCRVIPNATQNIANAIGTVFWASEDFPADEHTEALLNALSASPSSLSGRFIADLVGHLANLLPHCRLNVLSVCEALVQLRGIEFTSLSQALFLSGPEMVNIAMTLQRFSDTRTGGMTLFESLLELGLDDATVLLNEIDLRDAPARRREPRARRKRRNRS